MDKHSVMERERKIILVYMMSIMPHYCRNVCIYTTRNKKILKMDENSNWRSNKSIENASSYPRFFQFYILFFSSSSSMAAKKIAN
jgi:hypothetical protein